jgi:hypothetical protein
LSPSCSLRRNSEFRWVDLDPPVSRGWWALKRAGERLALLQSFNGRVSIVLYLGAQPWSQKQGEAGTIAQAKRFAERWLAAHMSTPAATSSDTAPCG